MTIPIIGKALAFLIGLLDVEDEGSTSLAVYKSTQCNFDICVTVHH